MKIQSLIFCLLALGLSACKNKKVVEEHPPGMETLRPKIGQEIPATFLGEWEICEVMGPNSVYTKVILSNSIEIKETVFNDEHCQLIESTKDRSVYSFFYYDYAVGELKAKIQSRKLAIFDPAQIETMNAGATCGHADWKIKKPKEVLGETCLGLPRDNKHDLSIWSVTLSGDKLVFNGKEMTRIKAPGTAETSEEIKVSNTTNSEVLPEPGSKNIMLVFPPKTGQLKIELPLEPHTNLKSCPSVLGTYQTSLNAQARIRSVKSEAEGEKARLTEIKDEINRAASEMVEFVEANNLQEYDDLIKETEQIDEAVEVLQVEYRGCQNDCGDISARLKDLRTKRYEVNNKIGSLRTPRHLVRSYYAHLNRIGRIEQNYEKQKEVVTAKEKQLKEAEDKLLSLFDNVDSKEGVPAFMRFDGQWGKNLKTLIDSNPKFKFRFAGVENVVMTYKLTGISNYPAHTSILKFPEVEATSLVKGRINLKRYPISMNGATTLSLVGACPAHDPEAYGLKLKLPRVLEFEVAFSYKH